PGLANRRGATRRRAYASTSLCVPWHAVPRKEIRMRTFKRLVELTALMAVVCWMDATSASEPPRWQPMLAQSFKGEVKNLGVTSLAVYRDTGCVFLQAEGKVYCSPAGATRFKTVSEPWKEVRANAEKKNKDAKHRFALTDTGITESTDGGTTWSAPIAPPKGFVIGS